MPKRRHALAETAAEYGSDRPDAGHRKVSISLPSELLEQVRQAAEESGVGVSGVIAAALRQALSTAQQDRLERALALDAEDNERWVRETMAATARAWSELEW